MREGFRYGDGLLSIVVVVAWALGSCWVGKGLGEASACMIKLLIM